jgi:ferredoxin
METTLFYFSASGNSLSLTHKLAKELGNCEIISIAKEIRNEEVKVKTPKVGFIFPIYAWGLPRIVSDFVQKLKIPHGSYVFAVATCVAIPGNTLKELKTTLGKNEINLNSGFVTRAESASLMKMNALDNIIKFLDTKRNKIKYVNDRMHEIVDCIKKEKNMAPETSNWSAGVFGSAFHRMGINAFKTKGSEFTINEDCSKCGTCLKVCPRNNIELLETGPKFNNDCELCHACIQWCPKFAIRHSDFDPLRKQYRNPNIVLSDIMTN